MTGRDCHVLGRNSASSVAAHADGGGGAYDGGDAIRAIIHVGHRGHGRADGGGRTRGTHGRDSVNGAVACAGIPSIMGRVEVSAFEVSMENVAAGQVSTPVSPPLLPLDEPFWRRHCHRRGRHRLTMVQGHPRFRFGWLASHTCGEAPRSSGPRGKILSRRSLSLITRRTRETRAPSSQGSDLRSTL